MLAGQTLTPAAGTYGVDHDLAIIVSRAPLEAWNASADQFTNFIADSLDFEFAAPPTELAYGRSYPVAVNGALYSLHLTPLPLMTLTVPGEIVDEPKTEGRAVYADDEQTFESRMGIEIRGGVSRNYPKKTYDIEFWEEGEGEESRDLEPGDLRKDDDWVLDALYNEPMRFNAYLAHKLWLDMHVPHYLDTEDRARSGADVMFVETFLNGSYQGLYLLSEQVDRKLLRLKKPDEEGVHGLMYKGVTHGESVDFDGLLPEPFPTAPLWGGLEPNYPKAEDTIVWEPVVEFVNFVMTANDQAFAEGINERFARENLADYFLFLNVIFGGDNRGKNIYLARQNAAAPWFYVPWDLDATFGNRWTGQNNNNTNAILDNGLMRRMRGLSPGGFNYLLCQNYNALRDRGVLSKTGLRGRYNEVVDFLTDNGIYDRERLVWPESLNATAGQRNFYHSWIGRRTDRLDNYFCELAVSTESPWLETRISVFPNPAADALTVRHGPADKTFSLHDLTGRSLKSGRLSGTETVLSVGGFAPGVYLLRVGGRTERVVVQ